MNREELQERINEASNKTITGLIGIGVSSVKAREWVDKNVPLLIERGVWSRDSIIELRHIVGELNTDPESSIWDVVFEACKGYTLSYTDRVRLYLDEKPENLSPEEEEDLEAMEELETICSDGCPVTDEHREMFHVLVQGLEPQHRYQVTPEEVSQFRELGKKFGMSEQEIELRISAYDRCAGSVLQKILSQQEIVDLRAERNRQALERPLVDSKKATSFGSNINRFYRT